MKTKTNFQKAAIRSAAVVVSFVLISYTVSAQEFWMKLLTHSSFNELAIAMVETNKGEKVLEDSGVAIGNWNNFDRAFDPALELEGWMSSKSHFEVKDYQDITEQDVPFNLEMALSNLYYSNDKEKALEMEDWMLLEGTWSK